MITFANAALLAEFLRRAEYAHKVSGAPDKGWSDWYAHYIDAAASHSVSLPAVYATRRTGTVEVFTPGDVAPTTVNIPAQGKALETQA